MSWCKCCGQFINDEPSSERFITQNWDLSEDRTPIFSNHTIEARPIGRIIEQEDGSLIIIKEIE